MKKTQFFLFLAITLFLGACGKDDSGVEQIKPVDPKPVTTLADRVGKVGASVLDYDFSKYKLLKSENVSFLNEENVSALEKISTSAFKPSIQGAKEAMVGPVLWVSGPDGGNLRIVSIPPVGDGVDLTFAKTN